MLYPNRPEIAISALPFEKKSSGKVLFLEDIRTLLQTEGMGNLLNCFADTCISQIGNVIGADIVIIGGIGQLGSNYLFSLKMVDVLRDNVISRTSVKVSGDARGTSTQSTTFFQASFTPAPASPIFSAAFQNADTDISSHYC